MLDSMPHLCRIQWIYREHASHVESARDPEQAANTNRVDGVSSIQIQPAAGLLWQLTGRSHRLPNVSVIIPTLNRKEHLAKCLRVLMNQTYRDFEIIVVDGGSTDSTQKFVKSLPVRLVMQTRKYVTNAYNCGVRAAKGDILVFVDDDVTMPNGWLEEIVKTYADFNADGVGGAVLDVDQPWKRAVSRKLLSVIIWENKRFYTGLVLRSGQLTENFAQCDSKCVSVDHLRGCNMSFRRKVFEKIGLFDEVYGQTALRFETDLCLRARANGFHLVYDPKAFVWHQRSDHISRPKGEKLGKTLFSNMTDDTLFALRDRKSIRNFSWIRFVFRQAYLCVEYVGFAIRRSNMAYLQALRGMLNGFGLWLSVKDHPAQLDEEPERG